MPPATSDIRAADPASAEQLTELRELVMHRAVDPGWRKRLYDKAEAAGGKLTHGQAVDALFYARTCAPVGNVPDRATAEQVAALRKLISTRVVAGPLGTLFRRRANSGALTYIEADRWIIEWLRLPQRPFIIAADLPRRTGWAAPDGYFALTPPDGFPRCYRIHTLPASGKMVVEQITGDAAGQRRKIYGRQATEVLQAIATDPATAAVLFARTRKRCARCNQKLEDRPGRPSWDNGYGDDCWTLIQPT